MATTLVVLLFVAVFCHGAKHGLWITSQPSHLEVREFESVKLHCKVEGLGNYKVVWRRGDGVLAGTNITTSLPSLHLLSGNTLELRKVTLADTGVYTCEIHSAGQRSLHLSHTVRVLASPKIVRLTEKDPIVVLEGSSVSVTCEADGDPKPSVVWFRHKDGKEKPREGATLDLVNVNRHQTGLYFCQASNNVGRPALSAINVRVHHIPDIEADRRWVHAGIGLRTELTCRVFSDPPGNTSWLFNDQPYLQNNSRVIQTRYGENIHSLIFIKVEKGDLGNYSCFASNNLGERRLDIELSGAPVPPIIVSSSDGKLDTDYTLKWKVYSNEFLVQYRIEFRKYKKRTVPDEWREIFVPADSTSVIHHSKTFTFSGLDAATVYETRVFAQNSFGWSAPSNPLLFSTFGTSIDEVQTPALKDQPDVVTAVGNISGGRWHYPEVAVSRGVSYVYWNILLLSTVIFASWM